MDYFGDSALFIITLPGTTHELVAWDSQNQLRQTLFEQGFYWPAWGNDLGSIIPAGTSSIEPKPHGSSTSKSAFQPDGSLQINGLKYPFLVIEVADTEGYRHARTKANELLMGSKGKIRFAIIIDLVRKTAKQIQEEATPVSADTESVDTGADDTENDENQSEVTFEVERAHPIRSAPSTKRMAQDLVDDGLDLVPSKKRRASSASPSPPRSDSGSCIGSSDTTPVSPTLPPMAPPSRYARATVTVITTRLVPHSKFPTKQARILKTLIDEAECWPTAPGPDVVFRFTWEDMNTKDYPAELQGRVFSVSFDWLHKVLESYFRGLNVVPDMDSDDEDDVLPDMAQQEDEYEEEDLRELEHALEARVSSGKVESDDSWR